MININIIGDSLLDLLVLHGDEAVDTAFNSIKDEFYDQVNRLKATGEYQEYSEALHQKLNITQRRSSAEEHRFHKP